MCYRGRGNFIDRASVALGGAMPNATAIGVDVDLVGVGRIGRDTVSPLEVVSANALPGCASIVGAPRGRFESRGIHDFGIALIHGDVVDVLISLKHVAPGFAAIRRRVDSASLGLRGSAPSPGGEQQVL